MKTLPSKLFPDCTFAPDEDTAFWSLVPKGFAHPVMLYLARETVRDEEAIRKAAAFFDRVDEWDTVCRDAFLAPAPDSEDFGMIAEYFDFYKEEAPDVFDMEDPSALGLTEMVSRLRLCGMASHGVGKGQRFTVDFTLGYDQLLTVYFDYNCAMNHLAWES